MTFTLLIQKKDDSTIIDRIKTKLKMSPVNYRTHHQLVV